MVLPLPHHDREAEVCRVAHRRWLSTLVCSSDQNDSMAALSPAAPTRPMEPTMP